MNLSPFEFLTLSISTWRIAYMLVSETGPAGVFTRTRTLPHGGVFNCIYCCSVWVGIGALILWHYDYMVVLYPFAISGAAMMLRSYTGTGVHDV